MAERSSISRSRFSKRHQSAAACYRADNRRILEETSCTPFPKPWPDILPLFTSIGLVDADFKPKPALAVWDRLHVRKLMK